MKIYRTRTFLRYLMLSIFVTLLTSFFLVTTIDPSVVGFAIGASFLISFLALYYVDYRERRAWRELPERRIRFANTYGYNYFPKQWGIAGIEQIAPSHIHGSRDEAYYNHIKSPEWEYCDFTYTYYGRTKYGEYKAGTNYYGVMFTRLPRVLPNVFFDSRKARGKQFRFTFTRKQKHSLEGNFDTFFSTYFPEDYTIDSMSFISPDVMHALIDAADYDIEIIGDVLCLYGPVSTKDEDLVTMSQKLMMIRKELMDNIQTYRDERLPFAVGRQRVAPQGMELDKSKLIKRLTVAAVILYIVVRFLLAFW